MFNVTEKHFINLYSLVRRNCADLQNFCVLFLFGKKFVFIAILGKFATLFVK